MVTEFGGLPSANAWLPSVRTLDSEIVVVGEPLLTIQPVVVSKPMMGLLPFTTGGMPWAKVLVISKEANAMALGALLNGRQV
jgi:hypothetical protein